MENRRVFLKKASLAFFSLQPTVQLLSHALGVSSQQVNKWFDYEFHFFGNNLTNLHFYFINATVTGKRLKSISGTSKAYMVVKVPQQHITEGLRKQDSEELSLGANVDPKSYISGFSFLAFELFPLGKTNVIDLSNMNNLMDWKNSSFFKLLIPQKEDYTDFSNLPFEQFKEDNPLEIKDDVLQPSAGYIAELYRRMCCKYFENCHDKYSKLSPFTLLELPEGLVVTPYSQSRVYVDTYTLPAKRYLYDGKKGRVTRTVEEIWSAQLFMDTVNGIISPPLRAAGYIDRSKDLTKRRKDECPDEDYEFLPTMLDKKEITYLTSLGRGLNEQAEWDIETRGLTLTGLGAIARFHYKNLNPPLGTDLAEYEHHFTLGRDEYIKVARIGVISATGQRALYVKIGQRKIRKGTTYMEFKEYIEIVQPQISYFDSNLFIKEERGCAIQEPQNFIQARVYPPIYYSDQVPANQKPQPNAIIHSIDGAMNDADNTFRDQYVWGNLPDKWHTHYRRWPFKKIKSITMVSSPINTSSSVKDVFVSDGCQCANAFWPVLSTKVNDIDQDLYMDFKGYDWNEKEVLFSSTFLFIRKNLIECQDVEQNLLKNLYANYFFNQKFERRAIRFINTKIALTFDFIPVDGEKVSGTENKSNISKVDYLEYYFTLCAEPIKKIIENDQIIPSAEFIDKSSMFNERFFPLYPQVKQVQLYIDNIQAYASTPLASRVEYNQDFINYGFEGRKDEITYNKGRLIFDHTEKFLKEEGYNYIKKVFSNAGDVIGGLVNPDFDIRSIGLIKQSIAIEKGFNSKYEKVKKFEQFNPSDLLRQAPEIFNGISLLDILEDVFPESQGPINEIKNLASKLDNFYGDLLDNPFYKEVKNDLKYINEKIAELLASLNEIQAHIDQVQQRISELKNQLNSKFFVAEIERIIRSYVYQYNVTFIDEIDGIARVGNKQLQDVVDYLVCEMISKAETIYPYYKIINDGLNLLNEIRRATPEVGNILDSYINRYLSAQSYPLINLNAGKKEDILRPYHEVGKYLTALLEPYFKDYSLYLTALSEEEAALQKYIQSPNAENNDDYLKFKLASYNLLLNYKGKITQNSEKREGAQNLLSALKSSVKNFSKIKDWEPDIIRLQNNVTGLLAIFETFNLPYYVDTYNKSIQDIKSFSSKLNDNFLQSVLATVQDFDHFINPIKQKRLAMESFFQAQYDLLRIDVDRLVLNSRELREAYTRSIGQEPIDLVLNAITVAGFPQKLKELRHEQEVLDKAFNEQITKVKEYELFLKNKVNQSGKEIIALIMDKIEAKKRALLDDPDNETLIKTYAKGVELYNILNSLSQKEVNYRWNITSFKNADFGIVSFLASTDPKTSLSVNVRNTIHFEQGKFPPMVSKVESVAENKINNFGISLLKAVIVNFNEVSFVAGTNRKPTFNVKVRDVQFAGAFSFVQALESLFKNLLGDNFSLKIQPQLVQVQYLLPIPYVGTPSFGFKDILFRVIYTMYFTNRPMELGVGIGSPENKTKLSVGIYTGLFYFLVIGNPKQGITTIEVSIEFGGYFGLSLGPLRGEVKLVVGLYYRKDPTGVIMEGYFLCEGNVKLWFVMVTARFYMGVRSQGNYVEGRCTVSYEISLGRFFKRSFSATYYKKIAGASPNNSQSANGIMRYNSTVKAQSGSEVNDQKLIEQLSRSIENPIKRKIKPLSPAEWETFINSYVD